MTPMQIWSNESQERYVLAIPAERLDEFAAMCERERCPFAVLGKAISEDKLVVHDEEFANNAVDMPLSVLLGKPPKMTRNVKREQVTLPKFDTSDIMLKDAVERVLRLPSVADKTFLISIGDRTVGGFTARDQMVGPWQVPVADVAVTTLGYNTYLTEAKRTNADNKNFFMFVGLIFLISIITNSNITVLVLVLTFISVNGILIQQTVLFAGFL